MWFLPFSPVKLLQLYNASIWFKGMLSRIFCPKTGTSWNSCRLVKILSWIKCLQVLTRVGAEHLDGGLYRGSWTALFSVTPTWSELFCFSLPKKFKLPESSQKMSAAASPWEHSFTWVYAELADKKAWFSQSLIFLSVEKCCERLRSCTKCGEFL